MKTKIKDIPKEWFFSPWIDINKNMPNPNAHDRVIVCDENGYVCIEDVGDEDYYRSLGYPVDNMFNGKIPSFVEMWKQGNGTNLVAWMPLPGWPENLCLKDADGGIP